MGLVYVDIDVINSTDLELARRGIIEDKDIKLTEEQLDKY